MKKFNKKITENDRLSNLESKVRTHGNLIETILEKLEAK